MMIDKIGEHGGSGVHAVRIKESKSCNRKGNQKEAKEVAEV